MRLFGFSSGSGKNHIFITLAGIRQSGIRRYLLYSGEDIRKRGLNYHRRHNVLSGISENYNLDRLPYHRRRQCKTRVEQRMLKIYYRK